MISRTRTRTRTVIRTTSVRTTVLGTKDNYYDDYDCYSYDTATTVVVVWIYYSK